MKTRTKLLIGGLVVGGAGALFALWPGYAAAAEPSTGSDGKPTGAWNPGAGGFRGGGAGGRLGGADVSEAVLEVGRLPPGSVLVSGPNLVGRAFAAGWYVLHGIDFGYIDAELLDDHIKEEGVEGDIEKADFVMAAVNPAGDRIRFYVRPPRSAEQMGEAVEEIAKFSGQTPK